MVVTAIGWRAHAALTASGGHLEAIAALSSSFYATAGGELVWVGPPGSTLHGRAVITTDDVPTPAGALRLHGLVPWRPSAPILSPSHAPALVRALRDGLGALGAPRGFGRLLGAPDGDDDIVRRARPWARALAARLRQ